MLRDFSELPHLCGFVCGKLKQPKQCQTVTRIPVVMFRRDKCDQRTGVTFRVNGLLGHHFHIPGLTASKWIPSERLFGSSAVTLGPSGWTHFSPDVYAGCRCLTAARVGLTVALPPSKRCGLLTHIGRSYSRASSFTHTHTH